MSDTPTPRTDAAQKKLIAWEKRDTVAGMRGSHLDSDDPRPPDGFATARTLERELAAKDATIKALESEKHRWQDARMEARREVLSIILRMDAETSFDEFVASREMMSGDYDSFWIEEKLRKLLDCDERDSLVEQSESAYYSVMGEMLEKDATIEKLRAALERIMKEDEAESHVCGPQQYNTCGLIARQALTDSKS